MIKFFKKEKSFKKADFTFNTNLYWKIAVFGAFILSVASAIFGYFLFKDINKEPVPQSVVEDFKKTETVNNEKIDKILNYFSLREKKSNQILNSPSPVVDPSL